MGSMQEKIIAITGGASGIGLATAEILSSRGATVCIADVDQNALNETEEFFGSRVLPFLVTKVDVTKSAEVESWVDQIVQKFGRLDGAANCAGILGKGFAVTAVGDLEDEEWDKVIAVNLTGMMHSLRAELRRVVDGGSLVCVASELGLIGEHLWSIYNVSLTYMSKLKGGAKEAAYVASKHAVIGLARSAAKEYGSRKIRVNCVAPGVTKTPMTTKARELLGKADNNEPSVMRRDGTAEEVGAVLAFLLGPESTFVTGAVYVVDGGLVC
jgi:NAD(P)-dependent dehydrogenase (short-subunit alcohol dehydrogenase family)